MQVAFETQAVASVAGAMLNSGGFIVYLRAQSKKEIQTSWINQAITVLVVASEFISISHESSWLQALSYASGFVFCLLTFLMSLRHAAHERFRLVDAALIAWSVGLLVLSHVYPVAAIAFLSLYYLSNYTSYLRKIWGGRVREQAAPWGMWMGSSFLVLIGMQGAHLAAFVLPALSLVAYALVIRAIEHSTPAGTKLTAS